jgi:hypothetical protein
MELENFMLTEVFFYQKTYKAEIAASSTKTAGKTG